MSNQMKTGTTRMGIDYCPSCGMCCDTATDINGTATPVPGDLSVCFYCADFLMFSEDMALIVMPDIVFENLPEDTITQLIMVREAILQKGDKP